MSASPNQNAPTVNRKPDTISKRYLSSYFVFAFIFFLVPAGIGVAFISLLKIIIAVSKINITWSAELFIPTAYVLGIVAIFCIASMSEAAMEEMRNIDHAMRRIVSIFVIGISDLIFRGYSSAAKIVYALLIISLLILGYIIPTWALKLDFIEKALALQSNSEYNTAIDTFSLFAAGFTLTWALLFFILPFFAILLPSWRKMAIRPALLPINKNQLLTKNNNSLHGRPVAVAQISDLHVDNCTPADSDPNAIALSLVADADVIALTGDLTDTGSTMEWQNFLSLPLISARDPRIVITPGNHDLNTWNRSVLRSAWTIEAYPLTEANRRAYLYLQVVSQVMGDRTWLVCPFTNAVRLFSDVYAQALPGLKAWDNKDKENEFIVPGSFLDLLFPMAVKSVSNGNDSGLICIVWNTVKPNRWAFLNSIGELGSEQVKRAKKLLEHATFVELPFLHLMHHQIAMPRGKVKSKDKQAGKLAALHIVGMGLETAEYFLEFIRTRSQRTCILHGHHHKYFTCQEKKSGAFIVSCPSSKCGTEISYSDDVVAGPAKRWLMLEFTIDKMHIDLRKITPMPL